MSDKFFVIGGEYSDTSFENLIEGTGEVHGPFDQKEADEKWRALTGKTVDHCMVRYRVVEVDALVQSMQH